MENIQTQIAVVCRDPIEIMVADGWRHVFELVTDGNDLKTLYNVCNFFREEIRAKAEPHFFTEILPFLHGYLAQIDFNSCRALWSHSKLSIDDFLQNDLTIQQKCLHKWYEFSTVEDVSAFLGQFEFHPGNPFLTRAVSVKAYPITFEIDIGDYLLNVHSLLERFGEHIWHFQLICSAEGHTASPFGWYRSFQQCLALMPNLKTLKLQISTSYAGIPIFIPVAKESHRPAIERLLATAPLQIMAHLKKLTIDCDDFSSHVLFELLNCSPAIQEIHDSMAIGLGFLSKLYLPGVHKRDRIYHPSMTTFTGNFRTKMELLNLQLFIWPRLKHISISFGRQQKWDKEIIDLKTIAGVLNQFQDSLISVKLNLGRIGWEQKRKTFPLTLPLVRNFEITGRSENLPLSMDFLLDMKTLEKLSVTLAGSVETISNHFDQFKEFSAAKIKLFVFWGKMYESNIWSALPRLKQINLMERTEEICNFYEYSREDYHLFQKGSPGLISNIQTNVNVSPFPVKLISSPISKQVQNPYVHSNLALTRFR